MKPGGRDEWIWNAASALNGLRNHRAHQLSSHNIHEVVEGVIQRFPLVPGSWEDPRVR
jgi:hypothetical protein